MVLKSSNPVKKQEGKEQFIGLILALLLLVISTQTAFGQTVIGDGQKVSTDYDAMGNVVITGGLLYFEYGSIQNLTMNGGTVNNKIYPGWIQNMTYTAGTYQGTNAVSYGIGTLSVAGNLDATNNDWGNVGRLKFDEGGIFTLFVDSFLNVTNTLFADSVNFNYGVILFDFDQLLDENFGATFSMDSLFNGATLEGNFTSFGFKLGDETTWFDEQNGDKDGWKFSMNNNQITFSYLLPSGDGDNGGSGGENGGDPNATPEPATLLMLSLGLAGAGLAVRRRRK